nr:hypothetical protein CFP56_28691 [Quercus suber]
MIFQRQTRECGISWNHNRHCAPACATCSVTNVFICLVEAVLTLLRVFVMVSVQYKKDGRFCPVNPDCEDSIDHRVTEVILCLTRRIKEAAGNCVAAFKPPNFSPSDPSASARRR